MRVLQIVHGLPPHATGGTELYVDALSRQLGEMGDEVLVVARDADSAAREYRVRRERRGRVEVAFVNNTFSAVRSFEESYEHPRLAAIVAGLAAEFAPDVAHIHHLTCLSTGIPAALRAGGVPMVFSLHDYWLICHRGQLLDRRYRPCDGPYDGGCDGCLGAAAAAPPFAHRAAPALRRLERTMPGAAAAARRLGAPLLRALARDRARARRQSLDRLAHMQSMARLVDRFLAPSEDARRRYVHFGIPAGRIARHEQGIELPGRLPPRSCSPGPLRVGLFGSLIPAKGAHVLLEAFRRLPAGAAVIRVYGNPAPYHDDPPMPGLADLLALPGVERIGPVPRAAVLETMRALDVVAVPSIWPENAPFVVREAFAAGAPVLASRVGGLPELVQDGVNGWLVEPGAIGAWEQALRALSGSREWKARVAPGGRVPALEDDAARTREHYRDVIASGRSNRPASTGRTAAVVLNYGTPDQTTLAAHALSAQQPPPSEIVIVDNGGADAERLAGALPGVSVLAPPVNLGFAGGVNVGIRHALERGADAVLLLNSDAILPPDGLDRLTRSLARVPGAGIAGPAILSRSEPDLVASLGMRFSERTGRMIHLHAGGRFDAVGAREVRSVDGVSGCAMLIRREVFDAIGLFDEDYFFGFEDLDFCLRARDAGFATVCCPSAAAYHEGGVSIGRRSPRRVYFGTRNHLKLMAGRTRSRLGRAAGSASVLLLSGAYVLRAPDVPLWRGLAALWRGARDHFAGRYGEA